jgi:hypothetical protein
VSDGVSFRSFTNDSMKGYLCRLKSASELVLLCRIATQLFDSTFALFYVVVFSLELLMRCHIIFILQDLKWYCSVSSSAETSRQNCGCRFFGELIRNWNVEVFFFLIFLQSNPLGGFPFCFKHVRAVIHNYYYYCTAWNIHLCILHILQRLGF